MQIVEHIFAFIGVVAVGGCGVILIVGWLLGPSDKEPDYDY